MDIHRHKEGLTVYIEGYNFPNTLYFFCESKLGCKDQESIQSSTTPDPGYQCESSFCFSKQCRTLMKRRILWHFIWVFIVCKSILGYIGRLNAIKGFKKSCFNNEKADLNFPINIRKTLGQSLQKGSSCPLLSQGVSVDPCQDLYLSRGLDWVRSDHIWVWAFEVVLDRICLEYQVSQL